MSSTTGLKAEIVVVNERGIHTRMATEIVKAARNFESEIKISINGTSADAKSVMGLLTLAAKKGTVLELTAIGPDQKEAFKLLKTMIEKGFPGVQD